MKSETYGDGVTLTEAVAIDTLLANPDDYVGRKIRVDGVITGVCKKRGCWMQVTDPDSGNGVRIKVEDGVIVFPVHLDGSGCLGRGRLRGHQADSRADRGPHRGRARPRRGRDLRQGRAEESTEAAPAVMRPPSMNTST